ncbi:MAG: hypothetical protein EH225_04765 [Calditrichaeota bacterium]|nr:tetratricopeptide repeat protein [Calditrichota bacterium]RQW05315.1 MAG: hypothetical protein EH225_04765 [Calditrichota bacterium]
MDLISYISGNVPGGIYLYILIVFITLLILFFMVRVNELFTRKHFLIWSLLAIVLYSVLYAVIWFRDPPPHHLRRYSIILSEKDSGTTWFSNYLTGILSDRLNPFLSDREYFFSPYWFYRISPPDSGHSVQFRQKAVTELPIHKVLFGLIERKEKSFAVDIEIVQFPSRKLLHRAFKEFNIYSLNEFPEWVSAECNGFLPFQNQQPDKKLPYPDSLLEQAKMLFFGAQYERCLQLLNPASRKSGENPRYDVWRQMAVIKKAGMESLDAPEPNRFAREKPHWQRRLVSARNRLINYIRLGQEEPDLDVMIAESYIWEKDFASAEIFLEKAYIENPFNIDVLLNLASLHPSRYQDFGFTGVQDIYEHILYFCPLEEKVLLTWAENILNRNPSYSAPPQYARQQVERYLEINPHSVNAWLMLGKIFAQKADRQSTRDAFLKADSISPANAAVKYNLGVLYYEWNKPDIAVDYLEEAIEIDNYPDAYLYLGVILMEKGKYQEALEKFRYRVSRKKGEDDFYAYQAMKGIQQCLDALGETDQ